LVIDGHDAPTWPRAGGDRLWAAVRMAIGPAGLALDDADYALRL